MPKIKWLIFEATPRCSLNCRHCYNIQKVSSDYPQKLLNTADTVQMLKMAISKIKCSGVVFTGGEVYTRSDVAEMINAVKECGIKRIQVMTNGSYLDSEKVSFLKSQNIRLVEMSFISADRDIFDTQAQSKGFSAFDNAVYATQELVHQGILVSHIFVATKKNIHTLLETLKLSYAMGVRNFSFNRFNPCGNGRDRIDELQLSPSELIGGLEICEQFAIEHPDFAIHSPINLPPCIIDTKKFKHISTTLCGVGPKQNILVMDYLGNIRLCSFAQTIVGNIKTMTLKEIFNSEKAKQFMSAHPDFCKPCKLVKKCQGGCKASSDNCFADATCENPFLSAYKTKPII